MTAVPASDVLLAGSRHVSATWLAIRETADAAARSRALVPLVRRQLAGRPNVVIHDLGSGTGSMARWLAPQLSARQHWILYDRDPDLLQTAAAELAQRVADKASVTVETRLRDVTTLTPDDLQGADLVTASALLDLLTVAEVDQIAAACVGARSPALLTISVDGRVAMNPPDPWDVPIGVAFNAHQRRTTEKRSLLGPDAVRAAVGAFTRGGATTVVRSSPWRLDRDDSVLASEWFVAWLAAACEQRPELAGAVSGYTDRRLAQLGDGRMRIMVGHEDLFVCHD